LGESQIQTGSGLEGESKTDGPKTNWQWTWGRVKYKLAVDFGESQIQTGEDSREKSKTGRPKTN
jgi:hypothetical protein